MFKQQKKRVKPKDFLGRPLLLCSLEFLLGQTSVAHTLRRKQCGLVTRWTWKAVLSAGIFFACRLEKTAACLRFKCGCCCQCVIPLPETQV
jgi:hypothetical protein